MIAALLLGALAVGCRGSSGTTVSVTPTVTPYPTPGFPEVKGEIHVLPSGLKYIDIADGNGTQVQDGQHVSIAVNVYLENGKYLPLSFPDPKHPFEYDMNKNTIVDALYEGVLGMKVGGKRRIIAPPEVAYGSTGVGQGLLTIVPPNTTVIFDVEVISAK